MWGLHVLGLWCVLSIFSTAYGLDIGEALLTKIRHKYGEQAIVRIEHWQQLIQTAQKLPEQDKLERVNDFFNQQLNFVDDVYLWGVNDYWATPLEFLALGAGDCEDFSIAKYFTLKALNVAEEKMRITYVKALKLNQAHMVLTYFSTPRSIPLVLDNLIPQIKLSTQRDDLLPVYSFNGSGLWLAKNRGNGRRVSGSERLNQWAELKNRMLKYVW